MAKIPKPTVPENYLYHSFARRHGVETEEARLSRSLKVLASIFDNGILLTPERKDFAEGRSDGSMRPLFWAQIRACFTLLEPSQLEEHTKTFGPISIEWEVDPLQREGALPAFYVPVYGEPGEATVGASLLARLRETQESFRRLSDLKTKAKANLSTGISLVNKTSGVATPLDIGTVLAVISHLEEDAVEIEDQFASIRTSAGYFSPLFDPKYSDDKLHYYRQREWRITQMWIRDGKTITKRCTDKQKQQLMEMDPDFFSQNIEMLGEINPRVEFCQYLSLLGGRPVPETIRRIIAPNALIGTVQAFLKDRGSKIESIALETLA